MSRHRGRTGCQLASMVFCVCGCGQWTSAALCPLRMLCIMGGGLAAFFIVKAAPVLCSRCHCIPFLSDIIMGNVVKGMFSSVAAVRLTAFLNCLSVQVMVNRSENRIRNCTIWGKVI